MKHYKVSAYDFTNEVHRYAYVFANNKKTAFIHALNQFEKNTALFIFTPFIFEWVEKTLATDNTTDEKRLHMLVLGATNVAMNVSEPIKMPPLEQPL